jgi:hypothetical protein
MHSVHLMGVLCEFFDTQSHWFLNEHVNRGFAQFAGDIYPPPMRILGMRSVKGRVSSMHSVKGRILILHSVKK